jgi:hypothetical protein
MVAQARFLAQSEKLLCVIQLLRPDIFARRFASNFAIFALDDAVNDSGYEIAHLGHGFADSE